MAITADAFRTGKAPSAFASSLLAFALKCAATVAAAINARRAKLQQSEQQRRDLAELAGLSDDLLRDMGATRGDIELELRHPGAVKASGA